MKNHLDLKHPSPAGVKCAQPRTIDEIMKVARWWLASAYVNPDDDQFTLAQTCMKIIKGIELGLGAAESIKNIYLMAPDMDDEGRIEVDKQQFMVSAHAQHALAMSRGLVAKWDIKQLSDNEVVITVRRRGHDDDQSFSATMEEFNRGHGAWRTHPQAMLRAKATTMAVKAVFPEVLQGVVSHDEGAEILGNDESEPEPEAEE